jgi:hypothetical protein
MKILSTLLIVTLAMGVSISMALAQHGHGGGAAGGHMGMPGDRDHIAQAGDHMQAGPGMHTPVTALAHNPALAARLQPLLPAGTNLQTAAAGFKNMGQFVAAVHVAHNLNIPFDELKAKMTGPNAESLGHAVRDLEPNLDNQAVKSDVKAAEKQARQDFDESLEATDRK